MLGDYSGISGARHDKNERHCTQSEEKQTGGMRQKYRSVQYLECEEILQNSRLNHAVFLCSSAKCYLFQSEEDIKSENDEADDMPEVQDTVQFIPGSKLLWRINCRPPNSSQVTCSN